MKTKKEVVDEVKRDANFSKSHLLDLLTKLESANAVADARKLGSIIGRLEAWQNSKRG
jgi:hypothetical protein